jgi:hypothetical protein
MQVFRIFPLISSGCLSDTFTATASGAMRRNISSKRNVWKTRFSSNTVNNMVDPKLLEAYLRTSFVIEAPHREIAFCVGEPSPEVDTLLDCYAATTGAFITDWNPRSVRLDGPENRQRQGDLV